MILLGLLSLSLLTILWLGYHFISHPEILDDHDIAKEEFPPSEWKK